MNKVTVERVELRLQEFFLDEQGADSPIDGIQGDDDLFMLGIIDSLKFLMLVSFVDDEFDLQSRPEDLDVDDFRTINNIYKYICRNTEALA